MKHLPYPSLWTRFCLGLSLILLARLIVPTPWSKAQTASTLMGLASGNVLVRFSSATPGTLISSTIISGLQPGEAVVAIDFRPATGQLYGLGIINSTGTDTGRLYLIDSTTGAATLVGPGPFSTTLADGANYGFDFNPVVDRIRVVNDPDQNFRLNPDTGALVAQDSPVDNPAAGEEIVGAAYDRNVAGATLTTLFGIDAANNTLVRQGGVNGLPSANGGVITTLGPLGLTVASPNIGFDIDGVEGTAFASLQNLGNNLFGLYTINLSTGQATLVGAISNGALQLRGLAVVPTRQTYLPLVVK
jgi:hypothetical protein